MTAWRKKKAEEAPDPVRRRFEGLGPHEGIEPAGEPVKPEPPKVYQPSIKTAKGAPLGEVVVPQGPPWAGGATIAMELDPISAPGVFTQIAALSGELEMPPAGEEEAKASLSKPLGSLELTSFSVNYKFGPDEGAEALKKAAEKNLAEAIHEKLAQQLGEAYAKQLGEAYAKQATQLKAEILGEPQTLLGKLAAKQKLEKELEAVKAEICPYTGIHLANLPKVVTAEAGEPLAPGMLLVVGGDGKVYERKGTGAAFAIAIEPAEMVKDLNTGKKEITKWKIQLG